jgi:hypothetical protein
LVFEFCRLAMSGYECSSLLPIAGCFILIFISGCLCVSYWCLLLLIIGYFQIVSCLLVSMFWWCNAPQKTCCVDNCGPRCTIWHLERVPSCVFKVLLFMLGFPSVIQRHLAMFQVGVYIYLNACRLDLLFVVASLIND